MRLTSEQTILERTDQFHRGLRRRWAGEYVKFGPDNHGVFILVPTTESGTRRGSFVPGCGFSPTYAGDSETAFSPDGRTLAVLYDDQVEIGTSAGARWTSLIGHGHAARTLAFAPDGRTLATGGHDGTVRLWDVEAGRERACYDWGVGIIDSVAFSPDGMRIAAGGKGGIVVWDVEGAH